MNLLDRSIGPGHHAQDDGAPSPPNDLHADRIESCLDTVRMTQVLQVNLPDCVVGGSRIESLQVTKVRRNASRRRNPQLLSLCYELVLRGASTDRPLPQTWFAGSIGRLAMPNRTSAPRRCTCLRSGWSCGAGRTTRACRSSPLCST